MLDGIKDALQVAWWLEGNGHETEGKALRVIVQSKCEHPVLRVVKGSKIHECESCNKRFSLGAEQPTLAKAPQTPVAYLTVGRGIKNIQHLRFVPDGEYELYIQPDAFGRQSVLREKVAKLCESISNEGSVTRLKYWDDLADEIHELMHRND